MMIHKDKTIVILGGARDYHALDWYRTVRENTTKHKVIFLTDLIGGEGFDIIINDEDDIKNLFIIDKFLFNYQSKVGNVWRNIVKLIALPLQIYYLKKFSKKHPNAIYHAHPMYYMLLCWLSNLSFIGTPQGDEILIRPKQSIIYNFFAKKVLQAAAYLTVDSVNMQKGIKNLSGANAFVYQNGVDIAAMSKFNNLERTKITSIRGMLPLYRIQEILDARNHSEYKEDGINFIFPYLDENYFSQIKYQFNASDKSLGRLDKEALFTLLSESFLVLSIPMSDSSPRSVYESIFLGCCVAVTYNNWIEALPLCMRNRLFIVELNDPDWFSKAVSFAQTLMKTPYIPSEEALEIFDQNRSMRKVIENIYIKELE
jgi:hypothetical protein